VLTTTSPLRERFDGGQTFADFAASVQKNADLWKGVYALVRMSDEIVARAAALGTWHLLVMAEDWCGDAVNTVPVLQRLTERAPNLDLRIISRDGNPDLMDAHLTGTSRSIPVVIMLDANYEERAWWGPRPTEIQAWVRSEGMALPKDERYKHIRAWYARDHGATTLDEVVSAMERLAASG
jgi:hypothetical protein